MKEIKKIVNLIVSGGEATSAPPIGPTLAQAGINIQEFCSHFNDLTKDQKGVKLPVVITAYEDRTFEFIVKKPPISYLLKKYLNLEKGAKESGKETVAKISLDQIKKIAEEKMSDLNTNNLEQAIKIVSGTARSMGIAVENKQ
ncbi:MAG: 50S ribosomal protein L11 [Patescibacteria group bacterium]|nr:50S ribosomal protein L11 [Patescibacteria group bacterium]MCL5257797.1 50S ribosomal protein L11 [Patescibacteria group bacterium]